MHCYSIHWVPDWKGPDPTFGEVGYVRWRISGGGNADGDMGSHKQCGRATVTHWIGLSDLIRSVDATVLAVCCVDVIRRTVALEGTDVIMSHNESTLDSPRDIRS